MTGNFLKRWPKVTYLVIFSQILLLSDFQGLGRAMLGEAFAGEVRAKTKGDPRIAIIDFGGRVGDESVRKNIVSTVQKTFINLSGVTPVSNKAVKNYITSRVDTHDEKARQDLKKGFKLLRDGKKAYNRMRIKEAVERLSRAKKYLVANLNYLKTNDALLEAYLYLGMAYTALGKKSRAHSEFKKVLFLDSQKHLSSKEYSPEVIRAFEEARQEILELPKGTLLVDTTPSNCTVYVNAKDIGLAPLNTLYPVGDYFLKIEKEGYLDWYQLVSIEDKINTIEVELVPIAADDELVMALRPFPDPNSVDESTLVVYRDIRKKLGADIILLGWIERSVRDMIAMQLFDTRTGKFSYIVQGSLGKNFSNVDNGVNKIVSDVASYIGQDGYVIAVEDVKEEPLPIVPAPTITPAMMAKTRKKKWTGKWWIWALVGGIAAGAAAGIIFGVRSGNQGITVINNGNF